MLRLGAFASVLAIGCGSVKNDQLPQDADPPGDDGDPPPDTSTARCDPTKDFEAATLVAGVNSSNDEQSFGIVRDESLAFIGHVIQPPNLNVRVLISEQTNGTFGTPSETLTAAINNVNGTEIGASPAADGLLVYFHRQAGNSIGIFAATRPDASSPFSAGAQISVDGMTPNDVLSPTISADGQTLYWHDIGQFELFSATRSTTPTNFVNRQLAATITFSSQPVLSADELTLFYSNGQDILVSTRASKSDMFGTGVPVPNVNSASIDLPAALSHDGCVLYISSDRPGGLGGDDIWEARRPL